MAEDTDFTATPSKPFEAANPQASAVEAAELKPAAPEDKKADSVVIKKADPAPVKEPEPSNADIIKTINTLADELPKASPSGVETLAAAIKDATKKLKG